METAAITRTYQTLFVFSAVIIASESSMRRGQTPSMLLTRHANQYFDWCVLARILCFDLFLR